VCVGGVSGCGECVKDVGGGSRMWGVCEGCEEYVKDVGYV
jgi:hypothetical protein